MGGGRAPAGLTLLVLLAVLVSAAGANAAERKPGPPAKGKKDPETLLVQFKADAESQADAAIRGRGDVPAGKVAGRVHLVRIKKGETVEAKVAEYAARPDVEYAEPNWVAEATALAPNDPRFVGQYGLTITNTPDAWGLYPGAFGLTGGPPIAVIDTGVESAHEDLAAGVRSSSGANCATTESDPTCFAWPGGSTDDNGHGTHVAGIAAAQTNNGIGIAGTSFSSPIIPVKSLLADGTGSFASVANAITWARTHGAKVINLSLGGNPPSYPITLCNAVAAANTAGVLVVAAAGNGGTTVPHYPAACPGAIGIGATDGADFSADFSNWWYPNVFISAPGVDIDSTYPPGTYAHLNGTSMATPAVAGLSALLFGQAPGRTVADVKRLLAKTADKPNPYHGTTFAGIALEYTTDRWNACAGTCSWHPFYGYGRIDAGQALLGPPAAFTSLFPLSGTTGTLVTITGQDLATASDVRFGPVSASFTVVNATKLTATVPLSATTGQVAVQTAAGTVNGPTFKVLPKITSFSEPDGAPGTNIDIVGSGFRGPIVVKFGLVAAPSAALVDSQKINVTVPPTAATGKVTVQTPDGLAISVPDFGVPKVTSLTPLTATTGTLLTINGTGLGRTTGVTFAGTSGPTPASLGPWSVFPASVTPTQVKVPIPNDAVTGTLIVHTPTVDLTTAIFKVLPKIASFSPSTGLAGTPVTITGSGLNGATALKFGLTNQPAFTVVSQNQITTTVPAAAASGKLNVTTPAGIAYSATDFGVTKITGLLPTTATTGSVLTINGTGLSTTNGVTINGVDAQIVSGSATATSVKVTVPANAITGPVAVTTPQGTVTFATPFKVLPKISGLTPSDGIPGTTVVINGSGFGLTVPIVKFGTVVATDVTMPSTQQVIAAVPAGTTVGKVTVQTADGLAFSPSDFAVPKVTFLTPTLSTTGTLLTINGVGLGRTSGVMFAGTGGVTPPTSVTPTAVKVVVPDTAINGPVSVLTPTVGLATPVYKILAKITSLTPATGIGGVTPVTITGSGLNGATSVKFGLTNQPAFTVDSQNQITTTVPATAATGKINVTTPNGIAYSATDFGVTKITSLFPAQATTGSALTIYGSGLQTTTGVTINGVAAQFLPATGSITPITPTAVRVVVPSTATTGPIVLTTPQGSVSFATPLKVLPKLSTITPVDGKVGDVVTITGSGFRGSPPVVRFGTVVAPVVTLVDSQTVTVVVPPGTTAGLVTVQTPDGSASSTTQFQITKLTSAFPTLATTGTLVTLYGTGLGSTTGVTVGGVPATLTPPLTAGTVRFTIPNTAVTGVVELTTPRVVTTLATPLKVLPKIVNVGPVVGPSTTPVTITGSGFFAPLQVKFGTTVATDIQLVSPTEIVAKAPVPATSFAANGRITVTTPSGTALSPQSFTLNLAPRINGIDSSEGTHGSTVTLTGVNFTGGQVKFGNAVATPTSVTPTQIVVPVPAGAPIGATTVSVTNPQGTHSVPFTVLVVIVSLEVTPATRTIIEGDTFQLHATGHYSDGTTVDLTSVVTWASGDEDVATVDAAGLVTAHVAFPDPVSITASLPGITGSAAITVKPLLVINEVDYDQPGGIDGGEFVEIYNPTANTVDLTGFQLVLVNGATDPATVLPSPASPIVLSGTIPAGGVVVVKNTSVAVPPGTLTFEFPNSANNVQNGSPDGLALVNTSTSRLIDALSYEGSITAVALFPPALLGLVAGTATTAADEEAVGSLVRLPDGHDSTNDASDWQFTTTPTPGAPNSLTP